MKNKNLPQIVLLRAVASIAVCFYHLLGYILFPVQTGPSYIASWGYLGVPVFFIVSGFIICYAMPYDYSFKDIPIFFKRRIIRIEPPYLVSIFLILGINFIAAPFNHSPFHFNLVEFLLHIGYLNNFFGQSYYNVVYWTLGLEFQFYFLIGFLFFYINRSAMSLLISVAVCVALSFIPIEKRDIIFIHLPIFALGFLTFFFKYKKRISLPVYLATTVILIALIFYRDSANAYACLFTLIVLNFWTYNSRIIQFFSNISYSFYLTQVTIGGRIENLGLRFVHNNGQRYCLFFIAISVSVVFGYLFYRYIEKPFITYARNIRYKRDNAQST